MEYFISFNLFRRCLVDPRRPKLPEDISTPLKNSFIHTGHGAAFGETWGNPAYIEDMYLKNPMEPPDVTGFPKESHLTPEKKKSNRYSKFSSKHRFIFILFENLVMKSIKKI